MMLKCGSNCRLWFVPVALALWPVVAYDYRQRRLGLRPDKWHWADAYLLRHGCWVEVSDH